MDRETDTRRLGRLIEKLVRSEMGSKLSPLVPRHMLSPQRDHLLTFLFRNQPVSNVCISMNSKHIHVQSFLVIYR